MSDESKPDPTAAFIAKAKDLDALRAAVVDAANVGAGLWLSYLFVLLYLLIAAGGVTHRDLLFENPIKLPFLSVELPLVGFFALGPLLFLIVHAYVLLHFVLLADKVGAFHSELELQITDEDVLTRLRRQLPSNIFVQFLAGPAEVRTGVMGFLLRMIAQISLVAAPISLLVFFQLQFLPYHHLPITWWHRITVVADLALLWTLWPSIARGVAMWMTWQDFKNGTVVTAAAASLVPIFLVFSIATIPGEWLDENLPTVRVHGTSLYTLLVAGDVDLVARKPTSLWSNRLVVPGIDVIDRAKFDTEAKINLASETFLLRGRSLEGAVLIDAKLRKVDFTAAHLAGAFLNRADLREAKFCGVSKVNVQVDPSGERIRRDEDTKICAELRGARLISAQLQGTSLEEVHLEGAWLGEAQMQGASLERAHLQGASLDFARLYGASLNGAELQGATLDGVELQGASLNRANLQGASLLFAQLFGTSLVDAALQGTRFNGSQLQGAALFAAGAEGASFGRVFVWRADPRGMQGKGISVIGPETQPKFRLTDDCPDDDTCDWSAHSYAALKGRLEEQIPKGENRDRALRQIASLDPAKELADEKQMGDAWSKLAASSPSRESYSAALAAQLQAVGCDPATAPYVIRGLLRGVFGRAASNGPPAMLAAAFLDEKRCPAARRLSGEDKTKLTKMLDGLSLRSPAEQTGAPKQ
jgi:uncharacterized protein YjbI with pentapeptide repeats